MRIAVDIMGGDSPPEILFEGVVQAANECKEIDSLLVLATQGTIDSLPKRLTKIVIDFFPVPEFITMDDSPLYAVRRKIKSSIVQGMQLVQRQEVDAFVSAGNTGALIMAARKWIDPIQQTLSPALLTFFPTKKEPMVVLDVGGTLTALEHQLRQYALLGAAFQRSYSAIKKPRVGLLNIGTESKKGTEPIRQAYASLQKLAATRKNFPFTFVGNIEGKEAFLGKVDVLVTDGFTGNLFLKTAEGISSFIFEELKQEACALNNSLYPQISSRLQKQFGYDEYPGAILCGVDGIVMKCHGYSTAKAMYSTIQGAAVLIQKGLLQKIKAECQSVNVHIG